MGEVGSLRRLDADAGLAPVPPLRVVPNGVVRPEADPVGDRPVLLLGLRKLLLGTERLVARHLDGLGLTVGESERGEVCW